MKLSTSCLLISLAVGMASSQSNAQEASLGDQATDMTCVAFLAPVLGRKEIAQIAVVRSIESRAVCSCAKAKVQDDARLALLFSTNRKESEERVRDPKVLSYALGRIMQSVMACFSTELDATLNAFGASEVKGQ